MLYQVALLVTVAVAALGVAVYVSLLNRSRQEVLGRALAPGGETVELTSSILLGGEQSSLGKFLEWLLPVTPSTWAENSAVQTKLVQAGYDSPTAPLTYATVRILVLVGLPVLMAPVFLSMDSFAMMFVGGSAVFSAWVLPVWYLNRQVIRRQEAIKKAVPDALDLLVICIEAGNGLDAALLRVARELRLVHPELAREFLVVHRRTNAGQARASALRGLVDRTGVAEVRALVSTMIQSEKWGTSVGNVLQAYAESFRTKRRQEIEKKAATTPLKMLFPLILFILPALFIVIMGPAVMMIAQFFRDGAG